MTDDVAELAPAPVVTSQLNDTARAYARASKSDNTRRAYAAQLTLWEAYADRTGRPAFPASAADVANWLAERAAAGQAYATLRTAIAAVRAGHVAHGLSFDTRAPAIETVMAGIGRTHAREQRQAEPIRGTDIAAVLVGLGTRPIDLRDGALFALGYVFALRRSELVALDYEVQGTGDGCVRLTARTAELVLARSKGSRAGEVERVVVPREKVSRAIEAIEQWIAVAGVQPGEPILRRVSKGGVIGGRTSQGSTDETGGRLNPEAVPQILRSRMARHYRERDGAPKDKARTEAGRFSGHSLRVGLSVTAAEAGATADEIATVTRHRSLEMPRRYAKKADALRRSPFNRAGMGLVDQN